MRSKINKLQILSETQADKCVSHSMGEITVQGVGLEEVLTRNSILKEEKSS